MKKNDKLEEMRKFATNHGKLGFRYFCEDCNKYFRYGQLLCKINDKHKLFFLMVCPDCKNLIEG